MTIPPPIDPRLIPATQAAPSPKPPRKTRTVFIVLGLLVGAIFIGTDIYSAISKVNQERRQNLAKLKQEADAVRAQFQPGQDLTDPEKAKEIDSAINRLSEAAGSVDARMKPLMKEVMEEFTSIGKAVSEMTKELEAAGGIDPASMKTQAAADERVAMLAACLTKADNLTTRVNAIPQFARDSARRHGLSQRETDGFMSGLNKTGNFDRINRIRQIDSQLFAEFVTAVSILRDNFGHWKIENGEVVFDDGPDGVTKRYQASQEKISTLSQEQERLNEQLQNQPR